MREPSYSSFFSLLKDRNFSVDRLRNVEDLEEVLYFLDPERTAQAVDTLKKRPHEERQSILRSLATLYPLSRPLVLAILQEFPRDDDFVLDGFHLTEVWLDSIARELRKMESKFNNTSLFLRLQDRIKNLNAQQNELGAKHEELQTLARQKEELEKRRAEDDLVREIDTLKTEIGKLREEIDGREAELGERKAELKQNQEQQRLLLMELESLKENGSEKQQRLWRELFATFPPDAEGA